ncbi:CotH kinase family protein [candidate division KSB1 bacterium]|nr:CotH kinase family protein [candidate division KSB1 bacterium]
MLVYRRMSTRLIKLIYLSLWLLPLNLWSDESWKLYDDSQVASIHIQIAPQHLAWLYQNPESDSLFPAQVHFQNAWIDASLDSVGFRMRGNTSRAASKKSFKLSFNTFQPGRQFYDVDKLNLNGEHNDPAIIRSKLCWDFFQAIGLIASRAAHAVVYLNDQYYGLYISVEHIDDEFLENHYSDATGNLWKCLWPADLAYRGNDPKNYYPFLEQVRPYELLTNVATYDFKPLARLITTINQTPAHLFADSLEQILIVPEVLKYFAMNVLVGSWDDYWFLKNNYYLYHEPGIDKFHWIPYDYDNTFGIDWFQVDWTAVDPYTFANMEEIQGQPHSPRPLAERLLANASYRNLYTHLLDFYQQNVYDLTRWESRLDALKTRITPWAEKDSFRTLDYGFTLTDFHNSYSADHYTNQHVKTGLKEFVNRRGANLRRQLKWQSAEPIIYQVDWTPKSPRTGDSIQVDAAAFSPRGIKTVSIQFQPGFLTVIQTYPMKFAPVAGTQRVEASDRWVGKIPPFGVGGFGHFWISATDQNGQPTRYPRSKSILIRAADAISEQIFINELLAKNDRCNQDLDGKYDDWMELYNPTRTGIALAGIYLTDNPGNLKKWQFPVGSGMLAAGGYQLVWCDGETNQPGLHANFSLSAAGEFLAVVARDGRTIIDSLSFGPQSTDVSLGRWPDGSGNLRYFTQPTPGQSNMTSKVVTLNAAPFDFRLDQNFPNPFNQTTCIHYVLAHRSDVQLAIYNLTGVLIKKLFFEKQHAGRWQVSWDGTDISGRLVSSGVYFYQIQAGDWRESRKMLLVK